MFERFTDRARRVVVLAQGEARDLGHNYIGTEHLLLGLIREGEGVAPRALEAMGIGLDAVRREVGEIIGQGEGAGQGEAPQALHIPFTPRAKKALELSLREALQLGHNYIGTEHILLGLIREGEGVAAQVLVKLGADLNRARQQVIQLLHGYQGMEPASFALPGEGPDVTGPESARRVRPRRVAPGRPGPPVRMAGPGVQLEGLTERLGEVISRLDLITERLASIEAHLAGSRRPAPRAPRKRPAPGAGQPGPPPAGSSGDAQPPDGGEAP
jgi:Clp amino terminal domain, pathogenicity island component